MKNGSYNPLLAKFFGHSITLWGYDDNEQVFYVYDSAVSINLYDKDIPVGNKKRTYTQILRDWKGALTVKLFGGQEYLISK